MYTKICPYCGYRNIPAAMVCANNSCGEMLKGVNIMEINDDGLQVPGPRPATPAVVASNPTPIEARPARVNVSVPNEHHAWRNAILSLVIPSISIGCLIDVIVFFISASNSSSGGDFIGPTLLGTCLGVPLVLLPFWLFGWLWLFPLIDCLRNEPTTGNERTTWTLVCIFLGLIGGSIYLIVRRPQRIAAIGY
jgi:hypothetical protein